MNDLLTAKIESYTVGIIGKFAIVPAGYILPHRTAVKIAKYPPQNSDGQYVELWVTAHPAKFYELRNADGEELAATGSGTEMLKLAHSMALAISDGMLRL